jgi:hypothetical protein
MSSCPLTYSSVGTRRFLQSFAIDMYLMISSAPGRKEAVSLEHANTIHQFTGHFLATPPPP